MTDDTGKGTLSFCVDPWPKNLLYWNYSTVNKNIQQNVLNISQENALGADVIRTQVKIAHITKGLKEQCAKLVVEVFTVSVDIAKSSSCQKKIELRPRTMRKNRT